MTKKENNTLKNKYIQKNSPISENFNTTPKSKIITLVTPKIKKRKENDDCTFQHIHEIYKINTTTPLI